ncbi:HAAS signaling domain-containing protein [Streptomyces sp. NPDC087440]|uniref:HAAS signaling domain-containing protein n=1 Tax=Streptomyces sp. NPDC087440 TaxID=3365790 RepID=UPI00381657F1
MKTSADPVHDYLHAVEREASGLSAERRQELVADLAEHIEVARTERPDVPISAILAELGDPRPIAETALAEAGQATPARAAAPTRRGKVHPLIPLVMLTLVLPFAWVIPVGPGTLVSVVLRLGGAVLLCTSVHWTPVQKIVGVLLTAVLPSIAVRAVNVFVTPVGGAAVLVDVAVLAVIAGTAAWLWRVRRTV